MKIHLFVAIFLSVVLASRRPFSGDHHDDIPPVSLRAILSPRTGTITAPNQVIVQGGCHCTHHNIRLLNRTGFAPLAPHTRSLID
jgi:hypothetical protein